MTLAEAWNGHAWSIDTTPNPRGGTNSVLAGISGRSATALIAVGSHLDSAKDSGTLAEADR